MTLDEHFSSISQKYKTLFPGESLTSFRLNLCLTFDDATYDFYHEIFPLLKKYKLKAVLGVPTAFIQKESNLSSQDRLNLVRHFSFKEHPLPDVFCSWNELREIKSSGLVKLASHSHFHKNLIQLSLKEIEQECVLSKRLLLEMTNTLADTFIYPYGGMSFSFNPLVKGYYPYTLRIGSSMNFSWNQPILYRVSADQIDKIFTLFSLSNLTLYLLKGLFRLLCLFHK